MVCRTCRTLALACRVALLPCYTESPPLRDVPIKAANRRRKKVVNAERKRERERARERVREREREGGRESRERERE